MTQCIHTVAALRTLVDGFHREGKTVGLVPTMGALHAGHLSLVRRSMARCDRTVVSIFVNPTQFGPTEDFDRYPRTLGNDVKLLSELEKEGEPEILAFAPSVEEMYPQGFDTYVTVGGPAKPLEGQFRPTHFRGVATVVLKLFHMSRCDVAFFGQKDFQQVQVIRQFTRDLNVPVEIEICPIVREADGLAMSSRNRYLSSDARNRALSLSRSLRKAAEKVRAGCRSRSELEAVIRAEIATCANHKIDYIAIVNPETLLPVDENLTLPVSILLAVKVDDTRLIDNILL
ncbi:MAG: pantoate--beta-alanine ligase [Planctomycetia bacterium]|nr:pantoate--beta-alanine ligase [Planctomycetia bacterium]